MLEVDVEKILSDASSQIQNAGSLDILEQMRVKYLGRKGIFTEMLSNIGSVPKEDRPRFGSLVNNAKQVVSGLLDAKKSEMCSLKSNKEKIDVTLPSISQNIGKRHPISQLIEEISDIFVSLGFRVVEGPEIETEHHNFEALNIPLEHPSRDAFDTFYVDKKMVLRSHTSPVQIRVMENTKPPLKIIAPGKVYRPDAVDATHCFMFHQIEGLFVDEYVNFGQLKWILDKFARCLFGSNARTRFRPHFFPFTEPSAEIDVSCVMCSGKGCRVCKGSGWLEVLGAGMVHPAVFKAVGYNSEKYTGFAFGMGVERIAMLKYGIDDIRLFFENDVRFLKQF